MLVQAFIRARAAELGWTLEIYGDGVEKKNIHAMIRDNGLEKAVQIHPPSTHLGKIWACASVFAMPSRYEGMPNALIEALSCGLIPLVCRGVGELAEKIEKIESSLVVPVDAVDELAASLRLIISKTDYFLSLSQRFNEIARPFEKNVALQSWSKLLVECSRPKGC